MLDQDQATTSPVSPSIQGLESHSTVGPKLRKTVLCMCVWEANGKQTKQTMAHFDKYSSLNW